SLKMPVEAKELRFNILVDDFRSYGECVIEGLQRWCSAKSDLGFKIADDNREGIRVSVDDGWFLLRLSVHDPVMPMNIESDKKGGVREILGMIAEFFYGCRFLDTDGLRLYLSESESEDIQ
ncbi:MAG: phosphomannomutase/phosphoglucomutase, partial [Acutalibacteraceae bacterium]